MPDDGHLPSKSDAIEIRKARPSDIDALASLEQRSFTTDRLSRRRFSALLKSPSAHMLIALRQGALAGYALVLIRSGSRAARLYSIAVEADEGRRGIGARLLAAAEAAARAAGAESLRLEVRADNRAAVRLYQTAGYRQRGHRPGYYEDGVTALLYSRDLTERDNPAAVPLGRAA
jgi:ribosomal protein S18 acetylase RimI-like enzyme